MYDWRLDAKAVEQHLEQEWIEKPGFKAQCAIVATFARLRGELEALDAFRQAQAARVSSDNLEGLAAREAQVETINNDDLPFGLRHVPFDNSAGCVCGKCLASRRQAEQETEERYRRLDHEDAKKKPANQRPGMSQCVKDALIHGHGFHRAGSGLGFASGATEPVFTMTQINTVIRALKAECDNPSGVERATLERVRRIFERME